MSSGFNTDVRAGERVFHVQTEDRGPAHFVIDTAVYLAGRVVLRRSADYTDFAASSDFTPESLRRRVEDQHRKLIEELRAGITRRANCHGQRPGPSRAREPARPSHQGTAPEPNFVALGGTCLARCRDSPP